MVTGAVVGKCLSVTKAAAAVGEETSAIDFLTAVETLCSLPEASVSSWPWEDGSLGGGGRVEGWLGGGGRVEGWLDGGWRVEGCLGDGGRVEGWRVEGWLGGGRAEGWRVEGCLGDGGRVEGWRVEGWLGGGRVEGWLGGGGRVEGWLGGGGRVEGWLGGGWRVEGWLGGGGWVEGCFGDSETLSTGDATEVSLGSPSASLVGPSLSREEGNFAVGCGNSSGFAAWAVIGCPCPEAREAFSSGAACSSLWLGESGVRSWAFGFGAL